MDTYARSQESTGIQSLEGGKFLGLVDDVLERILNMTTDIADSSTSELCVLHKPYRLSLTLL